MEMNRRDLGFALTALAALGTLGEKKLTAQETASSEPVLAHSQLFLFDTLPVQTGAHGMETRAVIRGPLATGEYVELHETKLMPGETPHPPHRHTHSEFLLIREGTLEVVSEGKQGIVRAGDVIFTASGVLHGLKNIGTIPAIYFVVAVSAQHVIA